MIKYSNIIICDKKIGYNLGFGSGADFKKSFLKYETENLFLKKNYTITFWKAFYENL